MTNPPLSGEAVEWITKVVCGKANGEDDMARYAETHPKTFSIGAPERMRAHANKCLDYKAEWLRHAESLRAKGGADVR